MERFCAYQERCENDVRRKLTSFHLFEYQKNAIIESLKANGFLDEERYVEMFVRSKVKAAWGKRKIEAALLRKLIPETLIRRYCEAIPDDEYRENLLKCVEKWKRSHSDTPLTFKDREKLIRHLISQGYRLDDILREL